MKRLVTLIATLVLFALVHSNATAQTVSASAEVVSAVSTTEQAPTNFGIISTGWDGTAEPYIDPSDGTNLNIDDPTNVQVGLVEVSGTPGNDVDVFVFTDIQLTDGTNTITFTPEFNYTFDNLTTGAPTNPELAANETADFVMTLDGGTDADGINTLLIGGTLVGPQSGLTPGTYSGTATLVIDYTTP